MQTDKNSAAVSAPTFSQETEQPTVPQSPKAVYRKSVLKRLGVLRSVAGSDPALDGLPLP